MGNQKSFKQYQSYPFDVFTIYKFKWKILCVSASNFIAIIIYVDKRRMDKINTFNSLIQLFYLFMHSSYCIVICILHIKNLRKKKHY